MVIKELRFTIVIDEFNDDVIESVSCPFVEDATDILSCGFFVFVMIRFLLKHTSVYLDFEMIRNCLCIWWFKWERQIFINILIV